VGTGDTGPILYIYSEIELGVRFTRIVSYRGEDSILINFRIVLVTLTLPENYALGSIFHEERFRERGFRASLGSGFGEVGGGSPHRTLQVRVHWVKMAW